MHVVKNIQEAFSKIIPVLTATIMISAFPECSVSQPGTISVHDPVMIKKDDTYYLFATGRGISVWSSTDMKNWNRERPVFDNPPQWAVEMIKDFRGHMWAPEIFFHNGLFYLFYSVSSFGLNTSSIGVATNKTLHSDHPDFKWVDLGSVVQSIPGRDLWNAIDPNVIIDENGSPWMTFGSFWTGIKLFRLNDNLSAPSDPQEWYTIASRERDFGIDERSAGNAAIEAPFLFQRSGYYYLFVSFDHCCRGLESDYKIMVGRSKQITGPYIDRDGEKMNHGGGSIVAEGNESWAGVGHNAVYTFDGTYYMIFHGYDKNDNGKSKLIIREITWDQEDWPIIKL